MSILLILAAVLPALFLLIKVYRADRLEKEPISMLVYLVLWGVLATELAAVTEQFGVAVLDRLMRPSYSGFSFSFSGPIAVQNKHPVAYDLILYFLIVGVSEEGIKFALLHWRTWKSPEFNCSFDGVVYAVFLSLGFALWENIHYALSFGLATALARAVTAVPGHGCFGAFMGTWYGMAKRASLSGQREKSVWFRVLAVLVPVLLHGVYDFFAVSRLMDLGWVFLIFIAVMFVISVVLVGRASRRDSYLF